MNSEELEQSLRAEFENYLKDVFSEIKQEVSGFQEKLDSEFREHRSRVNAALEELASKLATERQFENSFTETVTEHLRLAKDEGARITAMAFAEAEELRDEHIASQQAAVPDYAGLRDAISDITTRSTQAEILKSLVSHAAEFTARGAFFIVKNEHLVGWRVFGQEDHPEPDVVRDVYFPLSSDTALSEAVNSLSTVRSLGHGTDGVMYLDRLGFGGSNQMFAVPLVARGRGVAVLYADAGDNGGAVNIEAIETLVQIAGMTVELLAAAPGTNFAPTDTSSFVHEDSGVASEPVHEWESVESEGEQDAEPVSEAVAEYQEVEPEAEEREPAGFSFTPSEVSETEQAEESSFEAEPAVEAEATEWNSTSEDFAEEFEPEGDALSAEQRFDAEVDQLYEVSEAVEYAEPELVEAASSEDVVETVDAVSETDESEETPDMSFDFASSPVQESEHEEGPVESFEYKSLDEEVEMAEADFEAEESESDEKEPEYQPVAEAVNVSSEQAAVAETAAPARPRFGNRNIDLPIEVSESERQYHNAARRFARLLVSEIKLYNEQKVNDGCEANDLYDRLKEAIDRSREMYEKRVHGPVAETFDYFDYELVNNLAQGDKSKLGGSYPGPTV